MPIITCLPFEGAPKPVDFESLDELLVAASANFRQRSTAAHKERVSLAALKAHCGQEFSQHVLIPDELHASLRALHGVSPIVLLPPSSSSDNLVKGDAIVLFTDTYGSLKGLPPNKPATMLLNACGLGARAPASGECYFTRIRMGSDGEHALGGEAAPQMIANREWLELAQKMNQSGCVCTMQTQLEAKVAELRRRDVETSLRNANSPATATPNEPTRPSPPPPAPAQVQGQSSSGPNPDVPDMASNNSDQVTWDRLSWLDGDKISGSESTLTVSVRVPAGTRAKNIQVLFKDQWLRVEVTTLQGPERVPIDAKLFQEIQPHDCTWCVEDAPASANGDRVLNIALEKKVAMRWILLTRSD